MGKIVYISGSFYLLDWKMHLQNSKRWWWVLVGLDFAKCYIDDIIVFNSTMEEHGHHL